MKKPKIESQLQDLIDFIEIKKLRKEVKVIKETNIKQDLINTFNLECDKFIIIKSERERLARTHTPSYIG